MVVVVKCTNPATQVFTRKRPFAGRVLAGTDAATAGVITRIRLILNSQTCNTVCTTQANRLLSVKSSYRNSVALLFNK